MSIFRKKKVIFPILSAVLAMLVGALIFVIPPPSATQMHETSSGEYLKVNVAADITAELDANSSITVLNTDPPKVELLKGNIYFNVRSPYVEQATMEVTLGDAVIQDMGGSFSAQRQKNQYRVAVASRRIEIKTVSQTRIVNAGQKIEFDNTRIINESSIDSSDIAPWRKP